MKQVGIFLANGFEEVEAVTVIDFLRRADVNLIIAGVGTNTPTGAHELKINADVDVSEVPENLEGVILPGGMPGAVNLSESEQVKKLCRLAMSQKKLVAAICAAPAVVLGPFGLLEGFDFTCYPGFEKQCSMGNFRPQRVVRDRNLITSRGPGTSAEFAVEIIRYLKGDEAADSVFNATLQYKQ